jgi:cytochrome P450
MQPTSVTVQRVTSLAGDPAWLIRGYDAIKQLLTDSRLGRSHPDPARAARYSEAVIFGQPMAASPNEQAEHKAMRQLLTPSFSARRLALLRTRVQALVDGLLDAMSQQSPPVDLHEAIAFPLPALVICELLGVPAEDREVFRRWSDDAADMTDAARSLAGWKALRRYMRALIARKQQQEQPAEDVLSDLIAAHAYHAHQAHHAHQAEGATAAQEESRVGLTIADQIAPLAAGLLFAGHETTVAAIDKGIVLLLTHPDQREALQRDPTLIPKAVEEILRLPLPLPVPASAPESDMPKAVRAGGLPRYANADIELAGVTIRAGDLVLLDLQDANLDAQRFPAPETFDVARTDNPHVTFGYGPYYCIGAPLARIELQVLFGTLFQHFPTLQLAAPVEQLQLRSHLLTGGLTALLVTW